MIILGLDLATVSGVCYGRPSTTPVATAVRAPSGSDELGSFAAFYIRYFKTLLSQLHARAEPGEKILVNYEAPILPEKHYDKIKGKMTGGTNISTTRRLHSMGPMLEGICLIYSEEHDIEIDVRECHISSIKRELGGSGGAAKPDLVFAARRAGISLPEGNEAQDAADAFGAYLLAIRYHAPEHLPYWDRRVHSGMRNFRG